MSRRSYYEVCLDRGLKLSKEEAVCARGHRVWEGWNRCLRCQSLKPYRKQPYGVKPPKEMRGKKYTYYDLCVYRSVVFELDYEATCAYGHMVRKGWVCCLECKYLPRLH